MENPFGKNQKKTQDGAMACINKTGKANGILAGLIKTGKTSSILAGLIKTGNTSGILVGLIKTGNTSGILAGLIKTLKSFSSHKASKWDHKLERGEKMDENVYQQNSATKA